MCISLSPLLVTCCKQITVLTVYLVMAATNPAQLANVNVHYTYKICIWVKIIYSGYSYKHVHSPSHRMKPVGTFFIVYLH